MRRLVQAAAFPLIWSSVVLLAWWLLRVGLSPFLVAMGAGVVTFGCVCLLELVLPLRRDWRPRWRDLRVDGASLTVIVWVVGSFRSWLTPVLVVIASDVAEGVHLPAWPTHWPAATQIAMAVVTSQLVSYVLHRLHHVVPFLWRFHALHHSADRLYWLNASRSHPLEDLASQLLGTLTMLTLGAPDLIVVMASIVLATFGPFQHSNADLRWGPLDRVLSTAPVHRWHHSTEVAEANCNYGSCLLVWDMLFGTYRRFTGDAPARLGTGGDVELPASYLGQVISPFAWRQAYEARTQLGTRPRPSHPGQRPDG